MTRQSTRRRVPPVLGWLVVAIFGGLTIDVGAVLPWSSLSYGGLSIVRSGLDTAGAGGLAAILGLGLVGIAAAAVVVPSLRFPGGLAIAAGALAVLLMAFLQLVVVLLTSQTGTDAASTDIGVGSFITILGAILAGTAGLGLSWDRRRDRSRSAPRAASSRLQPGTDLPN